MRILVTGSAGFMGSHLVDYLSGEHEVWGLDDLSLGSLVNVNEKARRRFLKVDLGDRQAVVGAVNKVRPEIVYHLAAWAHEGLSQFAPILITENNYNAFLNLVVPLIKCKVKRVVVCSSMAVYGEQDPPFDEIMPRRPADIYGVAKAAMEDAVRILSDVHGFEYVVIRPHNVYGPRQNLADPYRNVVAIFINRMLMGKPFYIYGDGEQTRAFSYIDDVVPPLARSGLISGVAGEVFNIGPDREYSVNQLAFEVLDAFGRRGDGRYEPVYLPDRPSEVKYAYCTSGKAERRLGFKETVSLKEGVRRMVEWARGVGYQEPKYLTDLELGGEMVPKTWKKRLI